MSSTFRVVVAIVVFSFSLSAQQMIRESVANLQHKLSTQLSIASTEVKDQVSHVPVLDPAQVKAIPISKPPESTIKVVSQTQKTLLLSEVDKFVAKVSKNSDTYTALATTVVVIGAVLALFGSILSFLNRNRTAGIISLIVAAVVAAPSIYPLSPLSSFYRALAAQSSALQLDLHLRESLTEPEFQAAANQLKLLILYEGEHGPQIGNAKDTSEELSKELQVIRTGATVQVTSGVPATGNGT